MRMTAHFAFLCVFFSFPFFFFLLTSTDTLFRADGRSREKVAWFKNQHLIAPMGTIHKPYPFPPPLLCTALRMELETSAVDSSADYTAGKYVQRDKGEGGKNAAQRIAAEMPRPY